jgi:hypothetical protein
MRIRPRSPYEGLISYADMAYVTFLYENNETEFSKKLHVVPGVTLGPLASRSYARIFRRLYRLCRSLSCVLRADIERNFYVFHKLQWQ